VSTARYLIKAFLTSQHVSRIRETSPKALETIPGQIASFEKCREERIESPW
jgi:hypothetical protein